MSLLIPDTGLLIWMLLCFGVVFALLAKYGFPVITGMVNRRKDYIDESLKNAQEANRQLATLRAQGEEILGKAREEQARIVQEAIKSREQIIAQAREQAAIEGGKLLQEAKRQIQQEKENAIGDIRRQIAELSVGIAEKVLRRQLADEKEQMDLVSRMVDEAIADNPKA